MPKAASPLNKALFASKSDEWQTPPELFDQLWEEFGPFDLDPAARFGQEIASRIWGRGGEYFIRAPLDPWGEPTGISGPAPGERVYYDGLKMSWRGRVFLNPPYGREIGKWIEKAVHEVACGNAELVCALLPARTDTRWWQTFVLIEAGYMGDLGQWESITNEYLLLLRFLPRRLKFVGAKNSAPFPSAVVVWRR